MRTSTQSEYTDDQVPDSVRAGAVSIARRLSEPRMDLAELQVFLTVAAERSFSRAAERLHRTQPAVSQAIRRLETSSMSGCSTARRRVAG